MIRAAVCSSCDVPIPPGRERCSPCELEFTAMCDRMEARRRERDHRELVRPMIEDAVVVLFRENPRALLAGAVVVRMSFAAVPQRSKQQ